MSDSAIVAIYTISAFLGRGRPDATLERISTAGGSRRAGRASTASGVLSVASSRREQSPLPALAGFELIAEDVASHDVSLPTFRWPTVDLGRKRGRRVRRHRGSLFVGRRRGPDVVTRDRNLVAPFYLCAQRQTAGGSDNLIWRGRSAGRSACSLICLRAGVRRDAVDSCSATGALASSEKLKFRGNLHA
jgi:hypothetical protein